MSEATRFPPRNPKSRWCVVCKRVVPDGARHKKDKKHHVRELTEKEILQFTEMHKSNELGKSGPGSRTARRDDSTQGAAAHLTDACNEASCSTPPSKLNEVEEFANLNALLMNNNAFARISEEAFAAIEDDNNAVASELTQQHQTAQESDAVLRFIPLGESQASLVSTVLKSGASSRTQYFSLTPDADMDVPPENLRIDESAGAEAAHDPVRQACKQQADVSEESISKDAEIAYDPVRQAHKQQVEGSDECQDTGAPHSVYADFNDAVRQAQKQQVEGSEESLSRDAEAAHDPVRQAHKQHVENSEVAHDPVRQATSLANQAMPLSAPTEITVPTAALATSVAHLQQDEEAEEDSVSKDALRANHVTPQSAPAVTAAPASVPAASIADLQQVENPEEAPASNDAVLDNQVMPLSEQRGTAATAAVSLTSIDEEAEEKSVSTDDMAEMVRLVLLARKKQQEERLGGPTPRDSEVRRLVRQVSSDPDSGPLIFAADISCFTGITPGSRKTSEATMFLLWYGRFWRVIFRRETQKPIITHQFVGNSWEMKCRRCQIYLRTDDKTRIIGIQFADDAQRKLLGSALQEARDHQPCTRGWRAGSFVVAFDDKHVSTAFDEVYPKDVKEASDAMCDRLSTSRTPDAVATGCGIGGSAIAQRQSQIPKAEEVLQEFIEKGDDGRSEPAIPIAAIANAHKACPEEGRSTLDVFLQMQELEGKLLGRIPTDNFHEVMDAFKMAKALGVEKNILEKGFTTLQETLKQSAELKLQREITAEDVAKLQEQLQGVEILGAILGTSKKQTTKIKNLICTIQKKLQQRQEAEKTLVKAAHQDVRALQAAVENAVAAGVQGTRLDEARSTLESKKAKEAAKKAEEAALSRQAAKRALQAAFELTDIEQLRKALQNLDQMDISLEEKVEAKKELEKREAESSLRSAIADEDEWMLEMQLPEAETVGISKAFIAEARSKLDALRRRRITPELQQLAAAVEGADVSKVQAAIEEADAAGVPRALMDKEYSRLEIYQQALSKQQAETCLESAVRRIEVELKARSDSTEALHKEDVDALDQALPQADKAGADRKLIRDATSVLVNAKLKVAIFEADSRALQAAITKAVAENVNNQLLDDARSHLESILSRQKEEEEIRQQQMQARMAFEAARKKKDIEPFRDALEKLEEVGGSSELVDQAREELAKRETQAREELAKRAKQEELARAELMVTNAAEEQDIEKLEVALSQAEKAGANKKKLERAASALSQLQRKQQERRMAEQKLMAVADGDDAGAFGSAVADAEAAGVPESVLKEAHASWERRKELMERINLERAKHEAEKKLIDATDAVGADVFEAAAAEAVAAGVGEAVVNGARAVKRFREALATDDLDRLRQAITDAEKAGVEKLIVDRGRSQLEQREAARIEKAQVANQNLTVASCGDDTFAFQCAVEEAAAAGVGEVALNEARTMFECRKMLYDSIAVDDPHAIRQATAAAEEAGITSLADRGHQELELRTEIAEQELMMLTEGDDSRAFESAYEAAVLAGVDEVILSEARKKRDCRLFDAMIPEDADGRHDEAKADLQEKLAKRRDMLDLTGEVYESEPQDQVADVRHSDPRAERLLAELVAEGQAAMAPAELGCGSEASAPADELQDRYESENSVVSSAPLEATPTDLRRSHTPEATPTDLRTALGSSPMPDAMSTPPSCILTDAQKVAHALALLRPGVNLDSSEVSTSRSSSHESTVKGQGSGRDDGRETMQDKGQACSTASTASISGTMRDRGQASLTASSAGSLTLQPGQSSAVSLTLQPDQSGPARHSRAQEVQGNSSSFTGHKRQVPPQFLASHLPLTTAASGSVSSRASDSDDDFLGVDNLCETLSNVLEQHSAGEEVQSSRSISVSNRYSDDLDSMCSTSMPATQASAASVMSETISEAVCQEGLGTLFEMGFVPSQVEELLMAGRNFDEVVEILVGDTEFASQVSSSSAAASATPAISTQDEGEHTLQESEQDEVQDFDDGDDVYVPQVQVPSRPRAPPPPQYSRSVGWQRYCDTSRMEPFGASCGFIPDYLQRFFGR